MIYIIVSVFIVLASLLIVRVGTVALRITGLDPETASFQALSAFTGTGFTTTEADLITRHPGRRRTVKILIIVGNAFFASVVAMIISVVVQVGLQKQTAAEDGGIGVWEIIVVFAVLIVGFLLVLSFSWSQRFSRWLDHYIENRLARSRGYRMFQLQRVLDLAGGYTVGEFRVQKGSWLVGRSLLDLALGRFKILVLAVERGLRLVRTPTAATVIDENDNLICYGPIEGMKVLIEGPPVPDEERKTRVYSDHTRIREGLDEKAPPGSPPKTS
ncbi:MAG: TrkA C-terminal domain-containing protein [Planctomycetota bacterium]